MIPPADPLSHFSKGAAMQDQMSVFGHNYGRVLKPTHDRLIDLQKWVRRNIVERKNAD